MRPLSPKQQRFVEEYLVDLNGAAAARRAGYKARNADDLAVQLLRKTQVQEAIQAAQAVRSERVQLKADDVIEELKRIGFADLGQILDFTGDTVKLRAPGTIPEAARRALSSIKVKRVWEGTGDDKVPVDVLEFKLWDKVSALEKLGKHLGLFIDRTEVTFPGSVPISPTDAEEGRKRVEQLRRDRTGGATG